MIEKNSNVVGFTFLVVAVTIVTFGDDEFTGFLIGLVVVVVVLSFCVVVASFVVVELLADVGFAFSVVDL